MRFDGCKAGSPVGGSMRSPCGERPGSMRSAGGVNPGSIRAASGVRPGIAGSPAVDAGGVHSDEDSMLVRATSCDSSRSPRGWRERSHAVASGKVLASL